MGNVFFAGLILMSAAEERNVRISQKTKSDEEEDTD